MNEKFFSEYRFQDYRTARSIREAYGWDAPLFVEEEGRSWTTLLLAIAGVVTAMVVLLPVIKRMVA